MFGSNTAAAESVERYLKLYPWFIQLHYLKGGAIPAIFVKRHELKRILRCDEPHLVFESWERNLRRTFKVAQSSTRCAWKVWVLPKHFPEVLRLSSYPLMGREPDDAFNLDLSNEEFFFNK